MERLFVTEGDFRKAVSLEAGLEGWGYLKAQEGGRGRQPLRVGKLPEPADKRYGTWSLRTGGRRP